MYMCHVYVSVCVCTHIDMHLQVCIQTNNSKGSHKAGNRNQSAMDQEEEEEKQQGEE